MQSNIISFISNPVNHRIFNRFIVFNEILKKPSHNSTGIFRMDKWLLTYAVKRPINTIIIYITHLNKLNRCADTFTFDERCQIEENVTERFFQGRGEEQQEWTQLNIRNMQNIAVHGQPFRRRLAFINEKYVNVVKRRMIMEKRRRFSPCACGAFCIQTESSFVHIESRAYVLSVLFVDISLSPYISSSQFMLWTRNVMRKKQRSRETMQLNRRASADLCHISILASLMRLQHVLVNGKDGWWRGNDSVFSLFAVQLSRAYCFVCLCLLVWESWNIYSMMGRMKLETDAAE